MEFKSILLTSILYAIPYKEDPKVYALIVKNINKKIYLGNNVYTFELLFPNGNIKYLEIHDGYVNTTKGDEIDKPFINRFTTYPGWDVNSSKIEDDKMNYLIFDDHDILVDEYIKQFEDKINYDKETINNLTNDINRNTKIINYVKNQKYDK